GNRDRVARAQLRPVFDTRQADVEIAALDRLLDRCPGDLYELRWTVQVTRDQLGNFDIEAAHARRVIRVGFYEGRAALGIAAPAEGRRRGWVVRACARAQQQNCRERAHARVFTDRRRAASEAGTRS